jgi:hypothetical protein
VSLVHQLIEFWVNQLPQIFFFLVIVVGLMFVFVGKEK